MSSTMNTMHKEHRSSKIEIFAERNLDDLFLTEKKNVCLKTKYLKKIDDTLLLLTHYTLLTLYYYTNYLSRHLQTVLGVKN